MKGLLVPIFAFTVLKLILTLIITFKSLEFGMVVFYTILILLNIHLLICCILDKQLLPNSLQSLFTSKRKEISENKKS